MKRISGVVSVLCFVLISIVSSSSFAATPVCSSVSLTKRPLSYCYEDRKGEAGKANPKIAYYFHGLGGSAHEIFDDNLAFILDGIDQKFDGQMPIIVNLSLGESGVMGYEADEVFSRGLKVIESRIAHGKSVRRFLMGASMGGHNVLRLAAVNGRAFTGVAGLCPAMGTFNAFDDAQVEAYEARNADNLDLEFFTRALHVFRSELVDETAFEDNNPFTFLAKGAYDSVPVYLSVGSEDSLGFYEGVREFTHRSDLRPGMKVQEVEVEGGHCSFDIPSFLDFMVSSLR